MMRTVEKRFLSNTAYNTLATLITQLLGIFIIPLFLKKIGAELYSIYILTGLVSGYMALFDLGISEGLCKTIGEYNTKKQFQKLSELVSTGGKILGLIGVVVALIIYGMTDRILVFISIPEHLEEIARQILHLTALFALIQWPVKIGRIVLRGTLHIREISIVSCVTTLLIAVSLLLSVLNSFDIVLIRSITLFLPVCADCILVYFAIKRVPWTHFDLWKFQPSLLKGSRKFSLGILYSQLMSILAIQIDQLIISKLIGVVYVSQYEITAKPFRSIVALQGGIMGVIMPTLYNMDCASDKSQIQKILNDGIKYRALIFIPICYTVIALMKPFINLWMGEDYLHCALWAQLFVALLVLSIFGVTMSVATVMGHLFLVNLVYTLRIALNIALSITLVPKYGYGGVILGTLGSNLLTGDLFVMPYIVKRCGLQWKQAMKCGLQTIVFLSPVPFLILYLTTLGEVNTFIQLISLSLLSLALCWGISYFALLSNSNRLYLKQMVTKVLKKVKK